MTTFVNSDLTTLYRTCGTCSLGIVSLTGARGPWPRRRKIHSTRHRQRKELMPTARRLLSTKTLINGERGEPYHDHSHHNDKVLGNPVIAEVGVGSANCSYPHPVGESGNRCGPFFYLSYLSEVGRRKGWVQGGAHAADLEYTQRQTC
jgi:hypothetical protein